MNYKNENQDMQVEGIISNPFVAQDILKQLKALIEKHWGKDPVYCPVLEIRKKQVRQMCAVRFLAECGKSICVK